MLSVTERKGWGAVFLIGCCTQCKGRNGTHLRQAGEYWGDSGRLLIGSLIDIVLEGAQRTIHMRTVSHQVTLVHGMFQTLRASGATVVQGGMKVN